jgi:hypothetical protein
VSEQQQNQLYLHSLLPRHLHRQMRNTQPVAAQNIVMHSLFLWEVLCRLVPLPSDALSSREQLRRLLGNLPMTSADHWVFPLHGRLATVIYLTYNCADLLTRSSVHFALAVVINPLACLHEGGEKKTSVLYLDSMQQGAPLAQCEHFATAAVEWDAIRGGKAVSEPVDSLSVTRAAARIQWQSVPVSGTCLSTDLVLYPPFADIGLWLARCRNRLREA